MVSLPLIQVIKSGRVAGKIISSYLFTHRCIKRHSGEQSSKIMLDAGLGLMYMYSRTLLGFLRFGAR
jgi:hypothetical protein